jgi:hypothetical protein
LRTRDDRDEQQHPNGQQSRSGADYARGSSSARPLAGEERHPEHRQRQRRERQAGLQGVVFQHHLQVDRQGNHRPSERDVLQHLRRDAQPEQVVFEEVGIEQRRLALALAPDEPASE